MSMTHDEMIAVIAHHRDGGKVEIADQGKGNFEDTLNPIWDFNEFDYRIKPEPRSLWEIRNSNGRHDSAWADKSDAEMRASLFTHYTITEYKEVLP